MLVSQVAMTSKRSNSNIIVILHNNVAARKPNINILASKATTAKKRTEANILANKIATASIKSDTNKTAK